MSDAPRSPFRGALIVARRDLFANARSPRFLLLSAVVLLVMVGSALGLAGLSPTSLNPANANVLWVTAAYPGTNNTTFGIVAWVADVFGSPRAGVSVERGSPSGPFVVLDTKTTNATGWVAFTDLGPGFWRLRIVLGISDILNSATVAEVRPPGNFTFVPRPFDVLGDGSFRDIGVWVTRTDGNPFRGASVVLNKNAVGTTDANGYRWMRLDPGTYNLTVVASGETRPSVPITVLEPTTVLPLFGGPDFILYFLAFVLMYLFAPIVAIALSYDAMAKERATGSLELLLARPASRSGIALGKFLGSFLSVSIPILTIVVAGLLAFAGISGKLPDATFTVAFLLGTLALVATYVLIMQIFSTVARSQGTAILAAISVWLVFNVIWSIVVTLAQAAFGIESGTPAFFTFTTVASLLNPSAVYQLALLPFLPGSLAGVSSRGYQIPDWTGPVAFVAWIVVLLAIAVLVFRKKAV